MSLEEYTCASRTLMNLSALPVSSMGHLESILQVKLGTSIRNLPRGKGKEKYFLSKVIVAYAMHCHLGESAGKICDIIGVTPITLKTHTLPTAIEIINYERQKRNLPHTTLKNEVKIGLTEGTLPLNLIDDYEAIAAHTVSATKTYQRHTKVLIDEIFEKETGTSPHQLLREESSKARESDPDKLIQRNLLYLLYHAFVGMDVSEIAALAPGRSRSTIESGIENLECTLELYLSSLCLSDLREALQVTQ